MKKGRTGLRKVLTSVELMVFIIIIVGVAAGITILLYTGRVERARVTEATSIMGAIITSQKVERSRTGNFYSGSTIAEFKARGIDITDTKYFTYGTTPTPNGDFTITATPTDVFGATGGPITWPHPTPYTPHPMLYIEPIQPTEGKPVGSITAIEGEVYLSHNRDTVAFPAILGDPIYLYHHIQTEKQSRAQILLQDESLLNLAEDTHIQIEEYIYSSNEGIRSLVIRALRGKVRGIVGQNFRGAGSRLIISTPTDTIAVGDGSFVVDAAAGRIQ